MLKKMLKLNASDFAVCTAVVAGAFLLTELIVNIIMAAVRPDSVPTLGGILLPCLTFMMCLFINVFQVPVQFDFLLRFGVSRRQALAGTVGILACETVFAFLLSLVLAQADRLIANLWLMARPGLELETFAVPLWGVALMAVGVLALGLVCGAVIQRFGRRAMVILWVAFMALMMLMNVTGWDVLHNMGATPPAAIAVGALAVIAAVAWSVWSLLRACVQS